MQQLYTTVWYQKEFLYDMTSVSQTEGLSKFENTIANTTNLQ